MQPEGLIGGRYRIIRPIREGGMGTVFWAHDEALGREVALKVAPRATDHAHNARFIREARVASRLDSPNLVRVLEGGETDIDDEPHLFLAMELLRGIPLSDRLESGVHLSLPEALEIAVGVCRGLEAAHAAGVVHRDIKPENVFLAVEEGRRVVPKILDFGVSTAGAFRAGDRITAAGEVLGTPSYMSPEQASGDLDVTPATDLWSVGVLLYEALAHKQPFSGVNVPALFRSIREDQPERLPLGVDDRTRAIVMRCLQKDPEKRPRDAATLRAELERALEGVRERMDESPFSDQDSVRLNALGPRSIELAARPSLGPPPCLDSPPTSRIGRMPRQAVARPKSPAIVALLAAGLCVAAVALTPSKPQGFVRAEAGVARAIKALLGRVRANP